MAYNISTRDGRYITVPVKAETAILAGALVALNADGMAVPASDAANLKVIGRAENDVLGGAADGDVSLTVLRGVFKYDNSAASAVTAANLATPVYVADAHTVAAESVNGIFAGVALEIDADGGVWVDTTLAPLCRAPEEAAAPEGGV